MSLYRPVDPPLTAQEHALLTLLRDPNPYRAHGKVANQLPRLQSEGLAASGLDPHGYPEARLTEKGREAVLRLVQERDV